MDDNTMYLLKGYRRRNEFGMSKKKKASKGSPFLMRAGKET